METRQRPRIPSIQPRDLLAGVTVAAYLVPQVMAYSGLAKMPPAAGLWAAMAALAVYFLIGSSPQLSVGPESTTALMTGAALATLAVPGATSAEVASLLAFAVGGVCLLAWAGGLAFLADLLSKPVLVGYMAGIAGLMILSQIGRATGADVPGSDPFTELWWLLRHPEAVQGWTLGVTSATLAVLLVGSRFWPRGPIPLIGMLLSSFVVAVTGLSQYGVEVVGDLDFGLPQVDLPSTHTVSAALGSWALLTTALAIAVVGFTDNLLTARAFASRRSHAIDARRELLALGAANVAAGAVGGFPVSSSGSRTAIADAAGGRTRWSGLSTLAATAVLVVALGPVLARFPDAALAAVVIYAALRLVMLDELRRIAVYRRTELLIALVTTATVLGFGVLQGVLAAVTLSLIDVFRRIARPHDAILGTVPGMAGMHDVDDFSDAEVVPGLLVYRYDAPLFFANADDFLTRVRAAIEGADPYWVLLNAEALGDVDLTAAEALESLRSELAERGITFGLARAKHEMLDALRPSGLIDRIGEEHIFPTLPTAVAAFREAHPGGPDPGGST